MLSTAASKILIGCRSNKTYLVNSVSLSGRCLVSSKIAQYHNINNTNNIKSKANGSSHRSIGKINSTLALNAVNTATTIPTVSNASKLYDGALTLSSHFSTSAPFFYSSTTKSTTSAATSSTTQGHNQHQIDSAAFKTYLLSLRSLVNNGQTTDATDYFTLSSKKASSSSSSTSSSTPSTPSTGPTTVVATSFIKEFLNKIERLNSSSIVTFEKFSHGQSNPTFLCEITDDSGNKSNSVKFVVRKKPPGTLLPSAHAVDREFRITLALAEQGVPVATPFLLCQDPTVIGTSFYVSENTERENENERKNERKKKWNRER